MRSNVLGHKVVDGCADHADVSNAGVPQVIFMLPLGTPMQIHLYTLRASTSGLARPVLLPPDFKGPNVRSRFALAHLKGTHVLLKHLMPTLMAWSRLTSKRAHDTHDFSTKELFTICMVV